MNIRIDHIGIVVKDLDQASRLYQLIGAEERDEVRVEDQGVIARMIEIGSTRIELLSPFKEGPVKRFIDKRGEGIHHICIEVPDLNSVIERLKDEGYRLVDERPRKGVEGMIAFIHPASTNHVLIELKAR
ncbi:MAG TPA: methylmalonyl-CoA epimerase [bacterium (Candidatus Stahlbacteria)]|nr:methylmalonyl-CoA epimerase [Candidatus Stahlbacteria bacterium]